jgi:hypothetical protein
MTPKEYAADCIPELIPTSDLVVDGETPEMVADALLEDSTLPEGIDHETARRALIDRIAYLQS